MQNILIVFSGLPGTGKTTLAKLLSEELNAVYLRIDTIEQGLKRSSLNIDPAEDAGYEIAYSLASENLKLGRIVITDSVNAIKVTRNAWLKVAERTNSQILEIEVICSDRKEHRHRVETRTADIEGHTLPTWQEVLEREYDPWDREPLVIDTAIAKPDECLSIIKDALPPLTTDAPIAAKLN